MQNFVCSYAMPKLWVIPPKLLLMMKLTIVLMIAVALQVSATGYGQKINISEQNVPLEKIFKIIKKQSGYGFFYENVLIENARKVTINLKNVSITEVLDSCLAGQGLTYEIVDRTIAIKRKVGTTLPVPVPIPQMDVSGTVKDAEGNPIVGVSVTVVGDNVGTSTNTTGSFSIKVEKGSMLRFSFVGYETRDVTVKDANVINVVLKLLPASLNDVVVVGYGSQRKASVTGAVTTVTGREILRSPTSNVTNSLIGRLTGLSAVQRSGQPGNNEALINIRGSATYNNNAAIVVVDGVERAGFGDIDPNEIETITVLKDAASTAVFGIRGANGVIVITTKTGREGKPRISYTGNVSFQTYTGIPKAMSAYDNALLINEANRNDGLTETWTQDELQKFKDGSDPLGYPDINWFDYLTRKVFPQTQHNLSISGGTKVIKYFASIGYLFEDGIFKKFDSPFGFKTTPSYSRYNFRTNVDFTLSKDLQIGVRLGGKLGSRYQPAGLRSGSGSFSYDNIEAMISRILQTPSFAYPVTLPDGRIAQNPNVGTNIWNPFAVITRWGTREDDSNTMESTFNLNYKLDAITKGLSFKTVFGYDSYFSSNVRRNAVWAAYVIDRQTKQVTLSPDRPRDEPLSGLISSYDGLISSNLQTGFNYDRTFGEHAFTGLVLATRQLINQQGSGLNAPPRASQGLVGRITYNLSKKYFVEFNAAYNGSEQFAKGKQYGFFPAVSAGWTLSRENFMQNVLWVTNLKIRGSYGVVGNDRLNTRFLFLDNYSQISGGLSTDPVFSRPGTGVQFGLPTSLVNYQVVVPTSFGNPDVTWETGTKRNIGVEASLFNSALSIVVDLFDENRVDILTNRSSGLQTYGQAYPALNIGRVYNRGYEIEANYRRATRIFDWGISAQVSYARNKIISRDEPPGRPDYLKQEGKPVGQFFGYLTEGFYQSLDDIANSPTNTLGRPIPGDLKYKDYNGDGKIDADDVVPIGYSRTPEYIYSFSPSIGYKGISLNVLFQGVANVSSDVILSEQNNGQQMYEFQQGRWTADKAAEATWPALHSRGNAYISYRLNDFILQDASYLKIRNVELSWNLPKRWLSAMKIESLRIYVTGQNLFTWTKYKMYLDPENVNLSNTDFSKQSIYPTSRIYNFGVNLQL
jgi:TonB-linked SusC/RagA family outer membrane protein